MSKLIEQTKVADFGEMADRRRKLTKEDRAEIVDARNTHGLSYGKIAKQFGVSKRLVTFICNPEARERNLELRAERGGSKRYYDRAKHSVAMRKHRSHKRELMGASCR